MFYNILNFKQIFYHFVTYTCLAPALIFKSCFIKRTTYFRSFDVHLEKGENLIRLLKFVYFVAKARTWYILESLSELVESAIQTATEEFIDCISDSVRRRMM